MWLLQRGTAPYTVEGAVAVSAWSRATVGGPLTRYCCARLRAHMDSTPSSLRCALTATDEPRHPLSSAAQSEQRAGLLVSLSAPPRTLTRSSKHAHSAPLPTPLHCTPLAHCSSHSASPNRASYPLSTFHIPTSSHSSTAMAASRRVSLLSMLVLSIASLVSAQTTVYFSYQHLPATAFPSICGNGQLSCAAGSTANSYTCASVVSGSHYFYPNAYSATQVTPWTVGALPATCGGYAGDQTLPIDSTGLNLPYGSSCVQLYSSGGGVTASPEQVTGTVNFTFGTTPAAASVTCPTPLAAYVPVAFQYAYTTSSSNVCGTGSLLCVASNPYGSGMYSGCLVNDGTQTSVTQGSGASAQLSITNATNGNCNGYGDQALPLDYLGLALSLSDGSCINIFTSNGGYASTSAAGQNIVTQFTYAITPYTAEYSCAAYTASTAAPISQTQVVQWGYTWQCAANTLDYPCLVTLSGNATVGAAVIGSGPGAYYQMSAFTGTRTYYNRYGQSFSTSVSLAPLGELRGLNQLALGAPFFGTPTFRLGALIQMPGGLLANEIQLINAAGNFPVESVAINASNTNSLNANPASITFCSTAFGFTTSSYNPALASSAAFSASMAACTAAPSFTAQPLPSTTAAATPGLRNFTFTYSITDGATFAANVSAFLQTDGTVNYDQLGNLYYNVIGIQGTRSEQSLVVPGDATVVSISSLMAPNIIATSNLPYITNNNRIYPQYPFLDRYGLAYTVTTLGASTVNVNAVLVDGSTTASTDVIGVYIYRENTLDEQGLLDSFGYPSFNAPNAYNPMLSLTQTSLASSSQLVSFCYVMYGLPNTLDAPWSVVFNGTALINNQNFSQAVNNYGVTSVPAYHILGFSGTRVYTNRYGATLTVAVTADQLGEDADVGLLVPVTPYAPVNSVSFHLNQTIQTPGGLNATDLSFFLDPYPIEGTGYVVGFGTVTNALNNDPSRTVFVSNMPGFVPNPTWSNSNTAKLAGTPVGTTDFSQCQSQLVAPFATYDASTTGTGVRSFNLFYAIGTAPNFTIQANLTIVTDGTVNYDQLGNLYYNIAAIPSGTRITYLTNGQATSNNTIVGLIPLCSGPTAGSSGVVGQVVYCNNNRLYPQFPYVDRLGLSYFTQNIVVQGGASSATNGLLDSVTLNVYRHTILEEGATGSGESFTDNPSWQANLTALSTGSSAYQAYPWSYTMYCTTAALEYPCAVQVLGTAIVAANSQYSSTCPSSNGYGPLCNQPAYNLVGFVGTRTFYNKYGGTNYSYLSLGAYNEDYADQAIYLTAPYVDSDGVTFILNSTSGNNLQVYTAVQGGLLANVINVFVNNGTRNPLGVPTEGIAIIQGVPTNGSDQGTALVYDPSKTIFCSTIPGFNSNAYSASAAPPLPSGSSSMSDCTPKLPAATTAPSLSQGTAYTYSVSYSLSDGATFTVQTNLTLKSDGNVYRDPLGNYYLLPVSATGTRSYYTLSSGTASLAQMVSIGGIAAVGSVKINSNSLGGNNLNSNRFYPTSFPYVDARGISFYVRPAAFYTGNTASSTTVISLLSYKDGTLEEVKVGGAYPSATYQFAAIASGSIAPAFPSAVPSTGSSSPSSSTSSSSTAGAGSGSAASSSAAGAAPSTGGGSVSSTAGGAAVTPSSSSSSTGSSAVLCPPVTTATSSSSSSGSGLSGGAIAGIVVGTVVGALLLAILAALATCALCASNKDGHKYSTNSRGGGGASELSSANPANGAAPVRLGESSVSRQPAVEMHAVEV